MISSSLSIKILGCTFVVGMTIGIPLIVKNEIAKSTQARIDSSENLKKFFSNTGVTEMSEGEAFSDEEFESWKPNPEQEKYIANNWLTIIKKMPKAFFDLYADTKTTKDQCANFCYFDVDVQWKNTLTETKIHIPFDKAKRSEINLSSIEFNEWNSKFEFKVDLRTFLNTTDKDKLKTELQEIIQGTKVPFARVQNGTGDEPNQKEKKIATDLLFLQTLYEGTIDRLKQLDLLKKPVTSWEYNDNNTDED